MDNRLATEEYLARYQLRENDGGTRRDFEEMEIGRVIPHAHLTQQHGQQHQNVNLNGGGRVSDNDARDGSTASPFLSGTPTTLLSASTTAVGSSRPLQRGQQELLPGAYYFDSNGTPLQRPIAVVAPMNVSEANSSASILRHQEGTLEIQYTVAGVPTPANNTSGRPVRRFVLSLRRNND